MIDILVYLFENYQPDACPTPSVLARKLTAAGFEADDITAALNWLEGLGGAEQQLAAAADPRSIRIYDDDECQRLDLEARSFLAFLEQQEAIDSVLRETIIERALALPGHHISVDRLKVIVLAVIGRRQHAVDALILEELLAEDIDDDEGDDTEARQVFLN